MEARPDRGHVPAIVDRDRDAVARRLEGRLEAPDEIEVHVEGLAVEAPLRRQRRPEPGEVAAGRLERRPLDFDLEQPDDGIDDEVANRHALPDDLAMDLALGRDVDEDVAVDRGPAAEPAVAGEAAQSVVLRLVGTWRREAGARRPDAVLRELTLAGPDLAAAAQAAPAADRVEVDAEGSGSIEDRRPVGEAAAPPGRGEDDDPIGAAGHNVGPVPAAPPARGPPAAASARRLIRRPRSAPVAPPTPSAPAASPGAGGWGRLALIQR